MPSETFKRLHRLALSRKTLGSRPSGGAVYGTTGRCSCGDWRYETNETPSKGGNRIVKAAHKNHIAEAAV